VLCLQECRAAEDQLADKAFRPRGYKRWFNEAKTKKGYSGVAIYSQQEPDEVRTALGWSDFDDEGRYIEARFGKLSVVSLYLPSGSSKEERRPSSSRSWTGSSRSSAAGATRIAST
jgi:exodeoxyribonuclease-3